MSWRSYRGAAAAAVPVGAAVGALFYLGLYFAGNPDYRQQGGWSAFALLLMGGVAIGVISAVGALVGGAAILALTDRHLRRPARTRIGLVATGAGLGAAIIWLAVGVANSWVNANGASWFGISVIIAAVAGVIASLASGLILHRVEHRHSRSPHQPAEGWRRGETPPPVL